MTNWIDCKRGDRVRANDKATSEMRGKEGVCIADNTETQFGHKHVEIQFNDGTPGHLRTYELDMIETWEEFAKRLEVHPDVEEAAKATIAHPPLRKIVDSPQA